MPSTLDKRAEHSTALGLFADAAQVQFLDVRRRQAFQAEILGGDALAIGHDGGALDDVLQLTDITGPTVLLERTQRVIGEGQAFAALLGGEALGEGVGQQNRIALALAQRRNVNHDLGKAEIEILAETALR